MGKHGVFSLIVVVFLIAWSANGLGGVATFRGMGDITGGAFFSKALAVSADGTAAVGWSESWFWPEAFLWTTTGGMNQVGIRGIAWDLSANGTIIVGHTVSDTGGGDRAFKMDNGTVTWLGLLPGGTDSFSHGYGISADGTVVVGISSSGSGVEAVLWRGAGVEPLGDLAGGRFYSVAEDISGDGIVVIGYGDSAFGREAFRWTASEGMVGLGNLTGGSYESISCSVSSDGRVVVGSSEFAGGWEAFRWTASGGMSGLGDLPGGDFYSEALAASADGSVVVGTSVVDGSYGFLSGTYGAFIWDGAHGMRDLKGVLEGGYGLDLAGWRLDTATDISADGMIIVGYGLNPDGYTEGWIATIPEPATVGLLGIGGLMLLRRRRRFVG